MHAGAQAHHRCCSQPLTPLQHAAARARHAGRQAEVCSHGAERARWRALHDVDIALAGHVSPAQRRGVCNQLSCARMHCTSAKLLAAAKLLVAAAAVPSCSRFCSHLVSGYWLKHAWSMLLLRGHSLTPMRPPWLTWIHHCTLIVEPTLYVAWMEPGNASERGKPLSAQPRRAGQRTQHREGTRAKHLLRYHLPGETKLEPEACWNGSPQTPVLRSCRRTGSNNNRHARTRQCA